MEPFLTSPLKHLFYRMSTINLLMPSQQINDNTLLINTRSITFNIYLPIIEVLKVKISSITLEKEFGFVNLPI